MTYANKGNDGLLMIGYPMTANSKYIPVLLDAGITVGLVRQVDKYMNGRMKRELLEILTPESNVDAYEQNSEQYWHCVLVSITDSKRFGFCCVVGICSIDLSTSKNLIEEVTYNDLNSLIDKIAVLQKNAVKISVFAECKATFDYIIQHSKPMPINFHTTPKCEFVHASMGDWDDVGWCES